MKTRSLFLQLTILIGFCLILYGIFSFRATTDFLAGAQKVQGQIVDWVFEKPVNASTKGVYHARVRFKTKEGQTVEFIAASGDSSFLHTHHPVDVLYDPKDPTDAKADTFVQVWSVPAGLIALGLLLMVIPYILIRKEKRPLEKILWLRQNGLSIRMKVESVQVNPRKKNGGQSPWVIYCRPEDGTATTPRQSDDLWIDPQPYLAEGFVNVWVDPRDAENYWVDTSFLTA